MAATTPFWSTQYISDSEVNSRMPDLQESAHALADRLPDLLIDAKRISQTVAHGIHGRRRSGPGETFWQFRSYESSDSAQLIDWRRSASSDHLYVREREWEAAHTVWIWCDLSASMNFKSQLSHCTKRDRGIVLMLAAAELLVRGGERVGLMRLSLPSSSRNISSQIAETILGNAASTFINKSRPPQQKIPLHSEVLLFGDFLAPIAPLRERLELLAEYGARGHLVQILDPAEETLPFSGRIEFSNPSGRERFLADRVESLRDAYQKKLKDHREQLQEFLQRIGWSFLVHHTDRPATEPLLSLVMQLSGQIGRTSPPKNLS
ncbi:MAG: DUF58 domain-containing protein [Hyphomicrobium sp.]